MGASIGSPVPSIERKDLDPKKKNNERALSPKNSKYESSLDLQYWSGA